MKKLTNPTRNKFIPLGVFLFAVLLIAGCGRQTQTDTGSTDINSVQKIDQMLSAAFSPGEPGSSVIAVKGGETIFRRGYGLADLEFQIPVEPDMTFRIGSLTKQFTATAIFLLIEQGKMSLDDKITKYFPDCPPDWNEITVEYLMTHASGLKDYTRLEEWQNLAKEDLSHERMIEILKNQELLFPPGDHLYYSNSGYYLLGMIIEKISGQSYGDFIQANIFDALGMSSSHYGGHSEIIPQRVRGYKSDLDLYFNADYISMSSPFSAGGLLSSVDDLAKWNEALYSGKLLSEASLERMTTPFKPKKSGPPIVGYGCEITQLKGRKLVSFRGAINGFNSYNMTLPEEQLYIAVLQNNVSTEYSSEYLAKKIAALLIGDPYPEWQALGLPEEKLQKYAGEYKIDENSTRTIIVEGKRIFSQRNISPRLEMFPASENTFFYKGRFTYITFGLDDAGEVVNMVMHYEEGSQITAEKIRQDL